MALQIDLEDGFSGDTVVVSADGDTLWERADLTTNLSSSLAAIARLDLPPGRTVEVSVPTRRQTLRQRVTSPYLRVRLTDGQLELLESDDLPLHM
jgi:hypothetical protein